MIYSSKKLAQLVVECCVQAEIKQVVISPGSRNAPLTIGFVNHEKIQTYSIVDERCAAFFALGIAQQTGHACAVVCTSGSALLNYYPAVAEAFYSQIPLVVISADRPADLIDIGDGQTIRQKNVFANHILESLNLNDHTSGQEIAIQNALRRTQLEKGPIHLNVPFDEPLYETTSQSWISNQPLAAFKAPLNEPIPSDISREWNAANKKLIVVGVHEPTPELNEVLLKLSNDPNLLILIETTSNFYGKPFVHCIDQLIYSLDEEGFKQLQPDLLISFGGMIISKKIKKFLRSFKPATHWHVDPLRAYDTYFSLTRHIKIDPMSFFSSLPINEIKLEQSYRNLWLERKNDKIKKHEAFLVEAAFSDLKVVDIIMKSLPGQCSLQIANSSIIRYVQLFNSNGLTTHCNRGTSGIDGSTSTAIGAALMNSKQTVFITGDVSFLYDSNGLWNDNIKNDFRIILLNNNGGGIFKIIPGPSQSTALPYFETPHGLTAEHLCKMFGLTYDAVDNSSDLTHVLTNFYNQGEGPKLLEIFTPSETNDKVLTAYFEFIA